LPLNPLDFSYGIQDGTSTPGYFTSFFIRSKPLEDNPLTCTPRTITLSESIPLPGKTFFTLTTPPPDQPLQINAPIFGLGAQPIGATVSEKWHLFVVYLSRERSRIVVYNELGERVLNSDPGGTLAFTPVGEVHTLLMQFGDGI
jgi:hypothetical protein